MNTSICILSLATMGIGGKASAATPVSQKPNVIFILADDMAIGDISYYNHGITDTSNIDKLIEDGVVFSYRSFRSHLIVLLEQLPVF